MYLLRVLVVQMVAQYVQATRALQANGVTLYNEGTADFKLSNMYTKTKFDLKLIGIYEKSTQGIVVKSFDLARHIFYKARPYNITMQGVDLTELHYWSELTNTTRLVLGANIVSSYGNVAMKGGVYQVRPSNVLFYLMLRDWCSDCNKNNTIEFKIAVVSKERLTVSHNQDSLRNCTPYCDTTANKTLFQQFKIDSSTLSFSNQVSVDGVVEDVTRAAHISYQNTVTVSVPLSGSEVLYGPISIDWQIGLNGANQMATKTVFSLLFIVFLSII